MVLRSNPHANDISVIVASCSFSGMLTISEKSTLLSLEQGHWMILWKKIKVITII